jgi:YbbR domain-containing protein
VMRALFDNLALRGISLALAVLMWFVIAGEKTSERGLQIPVELQNFPKDLELTGDPVDSVEVRLRAAPGIIHGLGPRDISALIDLQGATAGERIVHLTADTVRVPFGVKVVKVTPSMLTLSFEGTLEKEVPVRPRLLGRPASGYEVAEVTSEPGKVRIAGPKSRVQEVESAFTEPVSVDGADHNVVDQVSLGLEDPLLRLSNTSRVRVTARIREVYGKRTFEGLPVAVRGGTAQLRPAAVRVVVTGPVSVLGPIEPAQVRPYVTVVKEGMDRAVVAVELASGLTAVTVLETDPAEVGLRAARKAN